MCTALGAPWTSLNFCWAVSLFTCGLHLCTPHEPQVFLTPNLSTLFLHPRGAAAKIAGLGGKAV